MAALIRFKKVEIDSNIIFAGVRKRTLDYPVRSTSLIPVIKPKPNQPVPYSLPEIFWQ